MYLIINKKLVVIVVVPVDTVEKWSERSRKAYTRCG
jgi:hypothetical protein